MRVLDAGQGGIGPPVEAQRAVRRAVQAPHRAATRARGEAVLLASHQGRRIGSLRHQAPRTRWRGRLRGRTRSRRRHRGHRLRRRPRLSARNQRLGRPAPRGAFLASSISLAARPLSVGRGCSYWKADVASDWLAALSPTPCPPSYPKPKSLVVRAKAAVRRFGGGLGLRLLLFFGWPLRPRPALTSGSDRGQARARQLAQRRSAGPSV